MKQPYPHLRLAAAFLLLITSFIIYSCSKGRYIGDEPTPDETAAQMKEWLNVQKSASANHQAADELATQAGWEHAYTFAGDSGKHYQVVQLADTSTHSYEDSGKGLSRYLVVEKKDGQTIRANVYEFFGNRQQLQEQGGLFIANFSKSRLDGFTGELARYSWQGGAEEVRTYAGGNLYSRQVMIAKPKSGNRVTQSGKKVATMQCYDYWWYTYIDGRLVAVDFMYTRCSEGPDECQMNSIRSNKGVLKLKVMCGAGGGGEDPVNPPEVPAVDTVKKNLCPSMTSAEIEAFNTNYNAILDGTCLQKALIKSLGATGRQLNICIQGGLTLNGNPVNATSESTGNITFNDITDFDSRIMMDEFFHQVQFSQYGYPLTTGGVGKPNIEFESDLFRDIARGTNDAFANAEQSSRDEYITWLNNITHNGTYIPKSWSEIAPNANAEQQYYHIVELYNNSFVSGTPHHGIIDYNRRPFALIDVINKSNCN
jgi:hypothetical protein